MKGETSSAVIAAPVPTAPNLSVSFPQQTDVQVLPGAVRTVQFIPSGLVIVIPALVPTVQKRLSSLDQQMEYQKRPVTGMVLAVQSMPFELVMNPL